MPDSTLSKLTVEPEVYVNGEPNDRLHVVAVERSAGGGRLDSATLEVDLALTGDKLKEHEIGQTIGDQEIEVVARKKVIHWGKVAVSRPRLSPEGIGYQLISRTDKHHFGVPIMGRIVRVKREKETKLVRIDRELVFNPVVDGKVIGNRSSGHKGGKKPEKPAAGKPKEPKPDKDAGKHAYVFLDEEGSRTTEALTWLEEKETDPEKTKTWSLIDAVMYLCWAGNPAEQFIENPPDYAYLRRTFDDSDDLLKDHELESGLFLPEALDRLLEPFGYGWYVDYLGIGSRRLAFFKRGAGFPKFVKHQKERVALNPEKTNVERLDVQYDATCRLFNHIIVQGDFREYESTFELKRAWPEDMDALSHTELNLTSEDYQENPDRHRVWRDWVLNEAGDYVGTRPEITEAHDFKELFKSHRYTTRRRKLLPTLTHDTDGTPIGNVQGVQVEWYDQQAGWKPIEELMDESSRIVHILEKECGIRFAGEFPPWEIMRHGPSAIVRVTATIRSDRQLVAEKFATPVAESVAPDTVPLLLMLPQKFKLREIGEQSIYFDRVKNAELKSGQVDDTEKLKAFIEHQLDAWNVADVTGSIVLTGLDHDYALGDTLAGLSGRNISFRTSPHRQTYPAIVGLSYNVQDQTLTLILESFREEVRA